MNLNIEEMAIIYSQDKDSCSSEIIQSLEIKTQNAGGGIYYVMKTDRWAFENIAELKDIITDFQERFTLKTKIINSSPE